jgi:hypothetical protein
MPATVVIACERRIAGATPDDIWRIVEPVEGLPSWLAFCERAEQVSGDGLGRLQRLHGRWGSRHSEIDQRVITYEPARRLSWTHEREMLDGKPAPRISVGTVFHLELLPADTGVDVRVRSEHVPANMFAALMLRIVAAGRAARGLEASLERLSQLATRL